MGVIVLAACGAFTLVFAQIVTLPAACTAVGITVATDCEKYISSLTTNTNTSTTTLNTNTTTGSTSGTTATNTNTSTSTNTNTTLNTGLTAPATCVDSDSGRNYLTKGYVMLGGTVAGIDVCIDTSTVQEQFCDGSVALTEQHRCDTGMTCSNGACVTAPTVAATTTAICGNGVCETALGESSTSCSSDCKTATTTNTSTNTATNTNVSGTSATTPTCVDSDGGQLTSVVGKVTFGDQPYYDTCADASTVIEQYCPSSTNHADVRLACGSGMVCSNGSCVIAPTAAAAVCGNGICEAALGESSTSCSSDCKTATTTNTNTATNTATNTNTAVNVNTSTNTNTATGAVVPPTTATTTKPASCIDSDGGKNLALRGYVNVDGGGFPDVCADDHSVSEQFCDGTSRGSAIVSCGDGMGCKEGACVKVATAATTAPVVTAPQPTAPAATDTTKTLVPLLPRPIIKTEPVVNAPTTGDTTKRATDIAVNAPTVKPETSGTPVTTTVPTEVKDAAATQPAEPQTDSQFCRAAGVFTAAGCEKYVFEMKRADASKTAAASATAPNVTAPTTERGTAANVNENGKPDAKEEGTRGTDSNVPAATDTTVRAVVDNAAQPANVTLPAKCVQNGITSQDTCATFLALAYLPKTCLDAGIRTNDDCMAFLKKTAVDPICQAKGITDADACKQYVYDSTAKTVTCQGGVSAADCSTSVKERHLGEVVDAQKKIDHIQDVIQTWSTKDGGIDLADIQKKDAAAHDQMIAILPVTPEGDKRLRAIDATPHLAISQGDTLYAAADKVVAYDTDGDGVPDDVEVRNGLDPLRKDSLGKGEGDAAALKRVAVAPLDKALANGKTLGQPMTQGTFDAGLTVKLAATQKAVGAASGVKLSGTGKPGDVVTVYIYSELPIVVTTTVDANGQWNYALDDSLKQGTHEVYVAVNDDQGQVTRRSDPLALVVSGAVAATAADAAEAQTPEPKVSPLLAAQTVPQYDLTVFVAGGIGLILLAFALLAALYRKKDIAQ
ncbi:MAG: hypothetical protein RLZZ324_1109 [Candidatus Parcubacteria bacterium]